VHRVLQSQRLTQRAGIFNCVLTLLLQVSLDRNWNWPEQYARIQSVCRRGQCTMLLYDRHSYCGIAAGNCGLISTSDSIPATTVIRVLNGLCCLSASQHALPNGLFYKDCYCWSLEPSTSTSRSRELRYLEDEGRFEFPFVADVAAANRSFPTGPDRLFGNVPSYRMEEELHCSST
jgi:hypothetical protein